MVFLAWPQATTLVDIYFLCLSGLLFFELTTAVVTVCLVAHCEIDFTTLARISIRDANRTR